MTAAEMTYESGEAGLYSEALAPGTVLFNGQYRIDRHLGSGGFGITYLARDSLERVVVIKECYPEAICNRENRTVRVRSRAQVEEFKTMVTMFVREARSIAKLNHPNIVGVHQVFEDNHTAYMALDFVDGLDLLALLEDNIMNLNPVQIKTLLLKSLDAVHTIHSQDMLHRDISPDNILIDAQGEPIFIDFGAAREEASKKSRALSAIQVVKDGYSPQEFYIAGGIQGPFSDLYSLAATFVHLITGEAPPNSQTRLAEIAAHSPDPYVPLAGRFDDYEIEFLQAIDKAISVFPRDRIQTAKDWLMLIDSDMRQQMALAAADKDTEIAETVSNLISIVGKLPDKTMPPTSLQSLLNQEAAAAQPKAATADAPQQAADTPDAGVSSVEDKGFAPLNVPELEPEPAEPAAPEPELAPASVEDIHHLAPAAETPRPPAATASVPVRPRRVSTPNREKTRTVSEVHVADALRGKRTLRTRLSATSWFVRFVFVALVGLTLFQASRVGFAALPASVIDTFLGLVFAMAGETGTIRETLSVLLS